MKTINIAASEIRPHPQIQRPLDKGLVSKLAAVFDLSKMEPLHVVPGKHGLWFVFDGQHRHAAAQVAKGKNVELPCFPHDPAPIEELADAALKLNTRKAWKMIDTWYIRRLRHDAVVEGVESLLKTHDLRVENTTDDGA